MRRDLGGLLEQLSQLTDEETEVQRSYLLEGHIVCNGGKFEGTVQLPFLLFNHSVSKSLLGIYYYMPGTNWARGSQIR